MQLRSKYQPKTAFEFLIRGLMLFLPLSVIGIPILARVLKLPCFHGEPASVWLILLVGGVGTFVSFDISTKTSLRYFVKLLGGFDFTLHDRAWGNQVQASATFLSGISVSISLSISFGFWAVFSNWKISILAIGLNAMFAWIYARLLAGIVFPRFLK